MNIRDLEKLEKRRHEVAIDTYSLIRDLIVGGGHNPSLDDLKSTKVEPDNGPDRTVKKALQTMLLDAIQGFIRDTYAQ